MHNAVDRLLLTYVPGKAVGYIGYIYKFPFGGGVRFTFTSFPSEAAFGYIYTWVTQGEKLMMFRATEKKRDLRPLKNSSLSKTSQKKEKHNHQRK